MRIDSSYTDDVDSGVFLSCFQIPNFLMHVLVGEIYLIIVEDLEELPWALL